MDTKTLVVGQKVRVVSGVYLGGEGTVIKITPWGVDVQLDGEHLWELKGVWGFNKDGKECNGHGTYECGPWELDDIL